MQSNFHELVPYIVFGMQKNILKKVTKKSIAQVHLESTHTHQVRKEKHKIG